MLIICIDFLSNKSAQGAKFTGDRHVIIIIIVIIEDVSDHGLCGVLLYSDKVAAEGFMKYVS